MQGWWAASYVVLWALVVMLCVIVVALARQIGTLHLRLGPSGGLEVDEEGPPLGTTTKAVNRTDIDGRPVTIGGAGESQLLLFVSPGCQVCEQVLPSLPPVARAARMTPYVVADADPSETKFHFRARSAGTTVIADREVAKDYDVPGTPFVVMLDDQGIVRAKGLVNNLEQMEGLADTARRRLDAPAHAGELG